MNQDLGQSLLRCKNNSSYYNWEQYNYFVVDFETENLNLHFNKPWEVGYITVEQGKITNKQLRRIWWEDLNISEDAARITGFNRVDYERTAEEPHKILNDITQYIENDDWVIMTYNGLAFDIYIYNTLRRLCGFSTSWQIVDWHIDILAFARAFRLGQTLENIDNSLDFLFWQIKLSKYFSDDRLRRERRKGTKGATLEALCKEFDCAPEGLFHSGLNDVIATWSVFEKLMWKFDITTEHLVKINEKNTL